MKRVGVAVLALIALAALLPIAMTFAPFTPSTSASGVIQGGTLEVALSTGLPPTQNVTVVWNTPPCVHTNMAPGDVCFSGGVEIHNTGSLTFDYSFTPYFSPASLSACYSVVPSAPTELDSPGATFRVPPGTRESFAMTLTMLPSAPQTCGTGLVGVTVNAVQSPDPHGDD